MSVTVTSNWAAALDKVASELESQGIDGIGRDVRVQRSPFDSRQIRPGCYVTPTDRKYSRPTSSHSTIGYGCMITVIQGVSRRGGSSPDRLTGWQEVVSRLFHDKRLHSDDYSSDVLCLPCKVEDETPLEPSVVLEKYPEAEVTSLVVRVWLREART